MSPLRARVLLLLLPLVAACATIHPWERGRLVSPVMLDDLDPLADLSKGHVIGTREAMLGAEGGGGASCGCN